MMFTGKVVGPGKAPYGFDTMKTRETAKLGFWDGMSVLIDWLMNLLQCDLYKGC